MIRWMNSDPRMIDGEAAWKRWPMDIDMQVLSVPFHGALVKDRAAAVN